MKYIVGEEQVKIRLDKFLAEQCPEFSRSQIKKLIENGKVKVGDKEVAAHYFLKLGEEVEAELGEPKTVIVEENTKVDFKIIYEDNDFLVIDKPAGLVIHQGEGHKDADTLVNGLLAKYPKIARVGDDPIRPGIVHRLDADVSGVMVIAKTQDMFDHLKKQFKIHEVEKEYLAVVTGMVSPPQGVIDFPIDRKEGKMVARAKGQEGKIAMTEYETIGKDLITTKLKVMIHTGRTHQIRVHLKAKGWPIVGDRLYGSGASDRLMLHARRIAFKNLNNEKKEFVVEAPF